MMCEKASYLINQLKNATGLDSYDEETTRAVINEINDLYEKARDTAQAKKDQISDPSVMANILVQQAAILRNKQCALTYLTERMHKIERLRWDLNAEIPLEVQNRLSQKEGEFLHKYDILLENYIKDIDLDITVDRLPPKSLLIEVRVLKDCQLPNGKSLNSNTSLFLPRSDVEALIRTGFLEHIS